MTLRAIRFLFRYAILLLITVYFLVAGMLLLTKYWFLPRIDQWRPNIEASLSDVLGTPVKIRQLQAEWWGLTPSFEVIGLSIEDSEGNEALVVPRIDARLSWQTLMAFEPRFRYIGISDLALAVVHDKNGVLQIAGFDVDLNETPEGKTANTEPWYEQEPVRWLLSQGRLSLNNATILWIDEKRNAPPLQLDNFSLSLRNRLLSHRLEGRFDVGSSPDQQIEFAAHSDRLKAGFGQMLGGTVDGEVYLALSNVDPQSLAAWVDVPPVSGRYAVRSWIDLSQGRAGNILLDVAALSAGMPRQTSEQTGWLADQLKLRVNGPLSMLLKDTGFSDLTVDGHVKSTDVAAQPMVVHLQGQRLTVMPPDELIGPVAFNELSLHAGLRQLHQGELTLNIQDMTASTPHGILSARGNWYNTQDDTAGVMDLQGTLSQFDLTHLHEYLPKTVGDDVLSWMKAAFTAGDVPQATFAARGPVAKFPFATPEEGDFTIDGTVSNWGVDYAPAEAPGSLAWPALQRVSGSLRLNRDTLSVMAQNAELNVSEGEAVAVKKIDATLRELYSEPKLTIHAKTEAEAAKYVTVLTKTALADVVPSAVKSLHGEGVWNLNLDLALPLADVEDVDFEAVLDLNAGVLRYADLPPLEKVTGQAVIRDEGFTSEGLTAQLLGSDLTVSGAFGSPGQALTIQSAVNLQALNAYFKTPSLNQWVKGVLPLNIVLTQPKEDGPYVINADTDMTGVQLAFPAPLVSAAGASLKTQFQWEVNPNQNSVGQGSLKVGNLLQVQAVGRQAVTGSTLSSVAIGVGAEPKPVPDGLTVNVATRRLNISEWEGVFDQIMKDFGTNTSADRAVMPELTSVLLNSNELLYGDSVFNDVVASLKARQSLYSAQFKARQLNGTASWQTRDGDLVGSLNLRLARLEVGDSSASAEQGVAKTESSKPKAKLPDAKTLSTIPPLDLVIEELVFNGVKLGKLEVVGENSADKLHWNVEKLAVTNKNIQATATGQWSFDHTNPGVRVSASMNVSDLGEALAALGVKDRVRRGRGTIKADLEWKRFPWDMDYAGLSGSVNVDLAEGIFDNINSGSARVLELLSLQSFGRLLDTNINRSDTFGDGFPWSTIAGDLSIKNGDVSTDNLIVSSPVARIAFNGGISLTQETLQFRATVRPNLDLSGTAMATGFLLNPIVGLSALVGNYILRNPIESILSLHYDVTGHWADPTLTEVGASREPNVDAATMKDGAVPAVAVPSDQNAAQTPENNRLQTMPSKEPAPVKENREVYRIELGKDSGFNSATTSQR